MCERPAPFDSEKALLLVELGDADERLAHAVNLLAYFREIALAGYVGRLRFEVIALTEVEPRGA